MNDKAPIDVQQHFVTFLSPGTLFNETSQKPIGSWDVEAACEMAHRIVERHGATPYAFYFTTRARTRDELDSSEIAQSGCFFLGGTVLTLEDVKRDMPNERILISNMNGNKIARVIVNTNSYKTVVPFNDKDVRLDWTPKKMAASA